MKLAETPSRLGGHSNAFGFLRLLFASLVIFSHVPEIVDKNANRELLYRITGEMTFGRFAVWGFFVISGYLITGSLLASSSKYSYLAISNGPPTGSAKSEPASHFPGTWPDENAKADVRFNSNGPPWRNPGTGRPAHVGVTPAG